MKGKPVWSNSAEGEKYKFFKGVINFWWSISITGRSGTLALLNPYSWGLSPLWTPPASKKSNVVKGHLLKVAGAKEKLLLVLCGTQVFCKNPTTEKNPRVVWGPPQPAKNQLKEDTGWGGR